MIGKNITRMVQVSLVLLILSVIQIIPSGEPIIDRAPVNSTWTETTQTDFTTDTSDVSKTLVEDVPLDFDMSKMDSSHFTENLGQWEDHIRFLAQTSFGYAALSEDGVSYYVVQEEKVHVIKLTFQNAETNYPIGWGDVGFDSNYFYGNDSTKWVTEARSYEKVLYKEVWPGIDILYYFKTGNLKYDIIISEHSTPQAISFFIEGHRELDIDEDGLEIYISEGVSISDTDLVAFYEDGSTVPIQFKKTSDHSFGFDVEKMDGRTLTIDPLVFSTSTFLGGSRGDMAKDMEVDGDSNIIILGETHSTDFPNTTGAFQTESGGPSDMVITKMDPNATYLIFSTYIGGWSCDFPHALDVDGNGDIYATGETWARNFPTTNGSYMDDPPPGSQDVFVLKLSSSGNNLIYSTYVGNSSVDWAMDIKIYNGYAYVVGRTNDYFFPFVSHPVDNVHGTIFFFILNQNGSDLTDTDFWGGHQNEDAYSLEIDTNGDAVVGGATYSPDFPTTSGAYQETATDWNNAFLLRYRPSTHTVLFSTYIGGSALDEIRSIYLDSSSNIYFLGITNNPGASGDDPFPTTRGAYDRTLNGSKDAFIGKMSGDGTTLIFSTLFGGEGEEMVGSIDVDSQGNVYFVGTIDSDVNFTVTPDAFDNIYNGEGDSLFAVLNSDGSNLLYCTYLGGNASDSGETCILAASDEILILGSTSSMDFPSTSGSYQSENNGTGVMFVTKFVVGNYIFLHEGWNLISVPLVPPDKNLDSVLSSISGYYDAVQLFDSNSGSWKHSHISKPSKLNTLVNIDHTKGFWIHISEPGGVIFEYSGSPPGFNRAIALYTGWNVVGYPASSNMQRDIALNTLAFGVEVDSIWYFDALNNKWWEMGPSDYFVQGRGYWFHSKFDTTWIVPL
jgi:hypothetical protein